MWQQEWRHGDEKVIFQEPRSEEVSAGLSNSSQGGEKVNRLQWIEKVKFLCED